MDSRVFDALTRRLTERGSRRRLARAIAGGLVGGSLVVAGPGETAAFNRNCRRFTLSGGKNIRREIDVDDDLTVYLIQNGNQDRIFHDNDGVIGIGLEPIEPIEFNARVGDRLRIVARDGEGPCRSLSPLWLHCRDGGSPKRLTRGVRESCKQGRPPREFFDETFRIEP